MPRFSWTDERDAYVDRRVAEGASYPTIAGELGGGVTAAAIAGRRHRRAQHSEQARAAAALRSLEANLGDPRVTQGGCRWVIGDLPGGWHWCGEKIAEGPYCAEHAARSKSQRKGD